MSMRDYAVNDYGLVLDEQTIKIIASKIFDDFADDDCDWGYELYNKGICKYISEFTGAAMSICDDGTLDWRHAYTYCDDVIYYVPITRISTLFKAAYKNMEKLVNEFKTELGEYLPDDFDYRSRIRQICGTYFG